MRAIQNYRDLLAWQKAIDLADLMYAATESFPRREWFGLAYQLRKSAVSIRSNIAEGHRRRTGGYAHHLEIALGSHGELDTQFIIGSRRRFFSDTHHRQLEQLIDEVGRITMGLARSIS
jgi:four helix bundle protein